MPLAMVADYTIKTLDGSGVCPDDWNERAATKKSVSDNRTDDPTKNELVNCCLKSYQHAVEWFAHATPDQLASP